ncbi:hypothetical protein quinque_005459 [Culex quinquefasciatus]
MNVAGIRRNIKNLAHNYSDAQIKVREATSNDPWGPSSTIMAEIADLTYNVVAFSEIMQMIWKRTNDHGKNWRHVYKALLLLEYLIKTGTEKVAQQCKENIYAIQTLKDFQYMEEGKDQGMHVREKAKQLVSLLKDDERLKNERARALKAKERFARTASGFGSDGSIDGPTQRDSRPPNWGEGEPTAAAAAAAAAAAGRPVSEIEFVRPQTVGEEELQLQLAMAMSREEAEQEEQKRRSDDVRLQLALSQSEQDFKYKLGRKFGEEHANFVFFSRTDDKPESSALVDLLDISFGAAGISSPHQQPGPSTSVDPWGVPVAGGSRPQTTDPWSRTSSPPVADPWLNSASALPPPASSKPPLMGAAGPGATGGQLDAWAPLRTQSPSVTSGSSVEGWLQNGAGATAPAGTNGNVDPWLNKSATPSAPLNDAWQPKRATPVPTADPWQANVGAAKHDPWAPVSGSSDGAFAVCSLLDDLDPLSSSNTSSTSNSASAPAKKTPASFLGENSALVNLDNLIKPISTAPGATGSPAAYNPFGESAPVQKNLFQQNQPQVPSINQLKQSPFPVTLGSVNQDPWAPVNPTAAAQLEENGFDFEINSSTTNISSLGPNAEPGADLDTNNNACDIDYAPEASNEEYLFNTEFLSTFAGKSFRANVSDGTAAPKPFSNETLENSKQLDDLYDFGFGIDDQYDVNTNLKTDHVSKSQTSPLFRCRHERLTKALVIPLNPFLC